MDFVRSMRILMNYETKPNYNNIEEYQTAKNEYELIQNQILEGQILRSKCQFYKFGEKPTKFFLNLEKKKV